MKTILFKALLFICLPLAILLGIIRGVMSFFKRFFETMRDYFELLEA